MDDEMLAQPMDNTENTDITELYNNIQVLCEEQGITIADLTSKAGIPNGSLSNWKSMRRWMMHLPAVARVLDVPIDRLFFKSYSNSQSPQRKIVSALERLELDENKANLIIGIAKLIAANDKYQ